MITDFSLTLFAFPPAWILMSVIATLIAGVGGILVLVFLDRRKTRNLPAGASRELKSPAAKCVAESPRTFAIQKKAQRKRTRTFWDPSMQKYYGPERIPWGPEIAMG